MAKGEGSLWLSAVKKLFGSPTNDTGNKSCTSGKGYATEEERQKRGKGRWIFGKLSKSEKTEPLQQQDVAVAARASGAAATASCTRRGSTGARDLELSSLVEEEKKNAIVVATATTAAAEAAVATAQTALKLIRLTMHRILVRETHAATLIQKSYRGYLARRAFRALKGLVKLQALVRGHNVRKRTNTALRCIGSVIRVQKRVRAQRNKVSHEAKSIVSMHPKKYSSMASDFEDTTRSLSRDGCTSVGVAGGWEGHPNVVKERNLISRMTEAAEGQLRKDRALDYKIRRSKPGQDSEELEGLDPLRMTNQWKRLGRCYCDLRSPIKTIEILRKANTFASSYDSPRTRNDHSQPKLWSCSSWLQHHQDRSCSQTSVLKPNDKPQLNHLRVSSSSSPRCLIDERNCHYRNRETLSLGCFCYGEGSSSITTTMPNYMTTTASAEARVRSQSQRPLTTEREAVRFAKRRLSFGHSL